MKMKNLLNTSKLYVESSVRVNINNLKIDGTKPKVAKGKVGANATVMTVAPEVIINGAKCESTLKCFNLFEQPYDANTTKVSKFVAKNCVLDGTNISHNLFNLYTFADNATVTFENCTFYLGADSNAIRFDNVAHAKNVLVSFVNCTWKYVAGDDPKYLALILLQMGKEKTAPLFGLEYNWKVVIKDCKYDNEVIAPENFTSYKDLTTTYASDAKSILYVYGGKVYDCAVDANYFPTVQIIAGESKQTYRA